MTSPSETGSRRRRAAPRNIGLWGAPGSGKTTFLAALWTAVNRAQLDVNIVGENDESTEFLIHNNRILATDHRFPPATDTAVEFSWIVNVNEPGRPGSSITPANFMLGLRDAPGRVYRSETAAPESRLDLGDGAQPAGLSEDTEDTMDYLARCDGLLLLIDPVREQDSGDSNDYFQGTMLRIAQRCQRALGPGAKLPHYVAVVITKFDHPQVYGFARKHNFRSFSEYDPQQFPRVHSEDAEDFFRELGQHASMSDGDQICNALAKYFYPDRVRYFVSSAIGFHCAGPRFREDDRDNAVQQSDGTYTIRGSIRPINVLEPILWLGRSVAAG